MVENRTRVLIMGVIIGALVGLASAWLATQADEERLALAESEGEELSIRPSARQLVTFGVAVVTLLRQVNEMLQPKT